MIPYFPNDTNMIQHSLVENDRFEKSVGITHKRKQTSIFASTETERTK